MLEGVQSRTTEGPALVLRCSVCDKQTSATSFQYGERLTLFHLIPLSPWTETNYVRCDSCRQLFVAPGVSILELPSYDPETLGSLLIRRVGLVPTALAVLGLLFSPAPIIGFVLAGIALAVNWQRPRHWTRVISVVAFIMASIVSLGTGILVLLAALFDW